MKYKANCKNCISQILNVSHYKNCAIEEEDGQAWIVVETQKEAQLIEQLNDAMSEAIRIYMKIINLTTE